MTLFDTLQDNTSVSSFESFWKLYPLKKDKANARKAFKRIKAHDIDSVIEGLKREIAYREQMAAMNEWVAPWKYAQGWLSGERWEDELVITTQDEKTTDAPWDDMLSKIGEVGPNDYPSWDDPKISKALYKVSSWMEVLRMNEKALKFDLKPRFMEAYNAS